MVAEEKNKLKKSGNTTKSLNKFLCLNGEIGIHVRLRF